MTTRRTNAQTTAKKTSKRPRPSPGESSRHLPPPPPPPSLYTSVPPPSRLHVKISKIRQRLLIERRRTKAPRPPRARPKQSAPQTPVVSTRENQTSCRRIHILRPTFSSSSASSPHQRGSVMNNAVMARWDSTSWSQRRFQPHWRVTHHTIPRQARRVDRTWLHRFSGQHREFSIQVRVPSPLRSLDPSRCISL